MVEFGLKLEDNKVEEWADFYIDYEKLKAILDKLKSAIKKKDELFSRKPDTAKEVETEYQQQQEQELYGNNNNDDPSNLKTPPKDDSEIVTEQQRLLQSAKRETPTKPANYGSDASLKSIHANAPSSAAAGGGDSIRRTLSGTFHGYLTTARYETKVLDALKLIQELQSKFETALLSELVKVNAFYESKIMELSNRFTVLIESVDASDTAGVSRQSIRPTHRKKQSSFSGNMLRASLVTTFTKTILGKGAEDDDKAKNKKIYDDKINSLLKQLNVEDTKKKALYAPDDDYDEDIDDHDPSMLLLPSAAATANGNKSDTKPPPPPPPAATASSSSKKDSAAADRKLLAQTLRSRLVRESDSIQRALGDEYRTAKLLHNFSIMNYTGFVKIGKKADKTTSRGSDKYKQLVANANICNDSKEVEALEDRMEQVYATWFCDGNVREAMAQLLPKRGDGLQMDWSQLRLGYRLGMCAILTLWVCWDCIWGLVRHHESTIGGRNAFPVFRACGGLLLLHWFWGASVYVWTRYRINYIFLFDFNPKTANAPISILNDAVDETLVFLVLMLLYYKAGAHDIPNWIPAGYFPAMLILYTVGCLVFPLRTRMPMWRAVFEVITSPVSSPTFFTIYIGDVFTSMVKVFQDMAWTFGFILSGDFLVSEDYEESKMHAWQNTFWYKNVLIPLICLFPLWLRFNQCLRKYTDTGKRFPNLANALKYAMSQTVTLFGAFHPLYLMHQRQNENVINLFQIFWMALFIASSLYSFSWDVYMDWGLGHWKHGFLSSRLMFPHRTYYYFVMAADLILRFMWVLTLVPPQSGAKFEVPQYLTAVTMALELLRRTMWGFFRLENEHRTNTNQYRRVSFVPLHFNTGHAHNYNKGQEHVGWSVLLEVAGVSLIVIAISVSSVIAAQRATRGYEL